ncbi:hypothetical protein [Frankia nepalensis]|uniref:hypothetical protein n=1 Tax=Frankia nepalensis TaxID=1836974 RepID=UPI001EE467F1
MVAVAAELPPSIYLDHHALVSEDRESVTLRFRELPPGVLGNWPSGSAGGAWVDAVTAAGDAAGWLPDVDAVPDRGITPYQLAFAELIQDAADVAAGARLVAVLLRVPPETVMVLAGMLRDKRARVCGCARGRHG